MVDEPRETPWLAVGRARDDEQRLDRVQTEAGPRDHVIEGEAGRASARDTIEAAGRPVYKERSWPATRSGIG